MTRNNRFFYILLKVQGPLDFYISVVYTKCDEALKIKLWDEIRASSGAINGPWGIVGDFNVAVNSSEKIDGRPCRAEEVFDFISSY